MMTTIERLVTAACAQKVLELEGERAKACAAAKEDPRLQSLPKPVQRLVLQARQAMLKAQAATELLARYGLAVRDDDTVWTDTVDRDYGWQNKEVARIHSLFEPRLHKLQLVKLKAIASGLSSESPAAERVLRELLAALEDI